MPAGAHGPLSSRAKNPDEAGGQWGAHQGVHRCHLCRLKPSAVSTAHGVPRGLPPTPLPSWGFSSDLTSSGEVPHVRVFGSPGM